MWQGYRVIDADAHMHEPKYLWERYVEPQYREQVPKVAFMDVEFMVYEPDGKIIPKGEKPISSRPPEKLKALIEKYGEGHRTWWAPFLMAYRCYENQQSSCRINLIGSIART